MEGDLIMKIEIFAGNNVKDLQNDVNNFIENKFVSGIAFNSVVVRKSDKQSVVNDRILVMYEDEEDNDEYYEDGEF